MFYELPLLNAEYDGCQAVQLGSSRTPVIACFSLGDLAAEDGDIFPDRQAGQASHGGRALKLLVCSSRGAWASWGIVDCLGTRFNFDCFD